MKRGEIHDIQEWAADVTYDGEQFGMYYDDEQGTTEWFFPRREDIDQPGKMIDAMLRLHAHPQWPGHHPITIESALRMIYAVAIADAIHETIEKIRMRGVRPIVPHPKKDEEDAMWTMLLDEGQRTAVRMLSSLERNEVVTES